MFVMLILMMVMVRKDQNSLTKGQKTWLMTKKSGGDVLVLAVGY